MFAHALQPNRSVSPGVLRILGFAWIALFIVSWAMTSFEVLPTPFDMLRAFGPLIKTHGLIPNLLSSLHSSIVALAWSAVLSLGLAYLSVVPLLRPLTELVGKFRFWGFTGVSVVFTLLLHGGRDLKIALLVFGITGFFATAMHDEVRAIPEAHFDYARTLGMSEWRVVWEVVVLGTLDRAFDIFKQNAAMCWMLLTMVETLVRSEGGVGVMLANHNKHMDLASVAAAQSVIFGVGILQDYVIGAAKNLVCPYASLRLARK